MRRKGISPVIATVIIVAVTIAVAIAVAFWMTGIIGLFTGFEQLQITSIFDNQNGIHLTVKNTGTTRTSITDIFINNIPGQQCNLQVQFQNQIQNPWQNPIPLNPGQQIDLVLIFLNDPPQFDVQPGVSLEIKLHTAAGKDYPKLIVLQQYTVPQQQQQGGQQQPQQGGQ